MARVTVVDAEGRFVESVLPAVARYALKQQWVRVFAQDPFMIQLSQGMLTCPLPPEKTSPFHTDAILGARGHMTTFQSPVDRQAHFNRTFKDQEDVWVVAVPDPGMRSEIQVVIECTDGANRYRIPPIVPGLPVCLTLNAPKEALYKCADLRNAVRAGRLALLAPDEADEIFKRKAHLLQEDPTEVRRRALERERAALARSPSLKYPKDEEVKSMNLGKSGLLKEEDIIKPWVMSLMQECNPELPENEQLSAREILSKLDDNRVVLSDDDLTYVRERCPHKSVKDFVKSLLAERSA